eukprot:TRINITY_DN7421_c1_g1_i3.p1 TRINITY_DN7421_c1_g1~~TRINITY_DN7421_c1_g1_i3.p1  ORF type:complete len:152 (+),score=34.17 TRINITY_DN7421_c1_g1_i3:31-486(+)
MSVTSRRHQEWPSEAKVYIGGLRSDCTRADLEDAFEIYGKILNVWIAQRPPGFGFILFEEQMDAKDSVRALDGNKVNGHRVKVEMARDFSGGGGGRRGRSRSPPPAARRPRSRSPQYNSRRRSRSRTPPRRRSRTPERRRRSRSGERRRRR